MNDALIACHCTNVDVASSDIGRVYKNRVCVRELLLQLGPDQELDQFLVYIRNVVSFV